MKNINNITSKVIRSKISDNWPTERFLSEYGITQAEFDKKIQEVFPIKRGRDEVLRGLKQNDKRLERGKNDVRNRGEKSTSVINTTTQNSTADLEEKAEDSEIIVTKKDQIAFLRDCIAETEYIISEVNADKERIIARRNEKLDSKIELTRKSLELESSLKATNWDLKEIIKDIEAADEKIAGFEVQIAEKEAKKAEFEAEIRSLTRFQIFAFKEGEVEIESEADEHFYIPDSWENVYEELSKSADIPAELDELLEDMTRKQIKQLAKLVALINAIKEKGLEYELNVEDEILQSAVNLCTK